MLTNVLPGILKVPGTIVGATPSVWYEHSSAFTVLPTPQCLARYSTQAQGDMCPNGYGQVGRSVPGPTFGAPGINGNGLSIYINPRTKAKTLVVVFSDMNANSNQHNALKIGIDLNTGAPIVNQQIPANSRLFLNRLGYDGARFLNPNRPQDLYITNFAWNFRFIQWATPIDPKVGIQVVQFSEDDLDVTKAARSLTNIPTLKYCAPSAGPIVDLGIVAAGTAPTQSSLSIKLFNSADCNPLSSYPSSSDPAVLNLSPTAIGSNGVITIDHTSNACNQYRANTTNTRYFQMRCMAGEQSNGYYVNRKYTFTEFATLASCSQSPITGGFFEVER
jgi:hypothetical protein